MPDLAPRKRPRQARSRATVDAILEACARILSEAGAAALTTNAIARRAGVSIGSLYEFFPNRDAVLAELARRRLSALGAEVQAGLESALSERDSARATELLVRRIVAAVGADRHLFRALLRETRLLGALPDARRAIDAFFELGRAGSERASARVALPHPDADSWLIGRMLAHAVLEIAFAPRGAPARELLVAELVRLTHRLIHGRDPEARSAARGGQRR
jgi:AcrR family transcriptional regulator